MCEKCGGCVGCENVVELCGNVKVVKMWDSRSRAEMLLKLCKNVEVVKMWDSRSRAEMLLKLCKNVEVVKNVVVVFFEKCGNDLNCVEMI